MPSAGGRWPGTRQDLESAGGVDEKEEGGDGRDPLCWAYVAVAAENFVDGGRGEEKSI